MKVTPSDLLALEVRISAKTFFVRFWDAPSGKYAGFRSESACITEAKGIDEVLEWAKAKCNGREFEVFAEGPALVTQSPDGMHMQKSAVRIYGENPTESEGIEIHSVRVSKSEQ
ncbi:hypothetical protein [Paeniglutamicibacter cryotolerans]|uniref:Uncharacterized protein n=1 Tax=Paeniglutamicibacter cryotolerans TaxID=670079 RepID=A0A839QR52_9MICC|nr:hypothetical protein [Paeniglutamicibacter cryotolerans]MBB2994551.1 hypothetical protein [Paeniglutamicibacter cryotolerans]